jgi:phospholipid transport system transporter-binding protein
MSTALPETLTLKEAPASLEGLRAAFLADTEPVWRIDASPLQQLDSSAIAVLLECHRIASGAQRAIEIVGAPPRLLELAQLYGVEALMGSATAASAA